VIKKFKGGTEMDYGGQVLEIASAVLGALFVDLRRKPQPFPQPNGYRISDTC
jgi:hypothetical protein